MFLTVSSLRGTGEGVKIITVSSVSGVQELLVKEGRIS